MSDPVSGTSIIVAGGLMGAGMFGLVTGIDYGVVFWGFCWRGILCSDGG
ncbi:prophage membrane protein [Klebsiella michiganensis]|uniref:Prophage membrane protein n=1 Tax=Klebsiella michiganensis TaxID=1134687 RepID=A0A7H4LTZ0_9ENTR|nr:prophage membrane protein [Klebsiella michiganensis]